MSKSASSCQVITFGCRLNDYESTIIARHLHETGLDCVVINSCAVTAEAERQVRQKLRQVRRHTPDVPIVVTGCAASLDAKAYQALDAVDAVVINKDKLQRAPWLALAQKWGKETGTQKNTPELSPPELSPSELSPSELSLSDLSNSELSSTEPRVRANLEIQQGCSHRCTFCIIPYARGDSVSIPSEVVIARAEALCAAGVKEITLTGVDIASWGAEWNLSLSDLVRRILDAVPDLPRLRLSSLDPIAVDEDFLSLWESEPRLLPWLHLSMQAGDDLILKRMRRRHNTDLLRHVTTELRRHRPQAALGADLIAGFPTESEEAFVRGYNLVTELALPFLHVFPYSPRPDTPAAKMPQVPRHHARTRARQLRALGEQLKRAYQLTFQDQVREILFEDSHKGRTLEGILATSTSPHEVGSLVACRLGVEDEGRQVRAWQVA